MFFRNESSFLSNFYHCKFSCHNRIWLTAEHAYQASKCVWPKDVDYIQHCPSPNAAKKAGRHVDLRLDWEEIKVSVMTKIVNCKFKQNIYLMNMLLDTKLTYLEEVNYWHDNTWGNCYCPQCVEKTGQNILGKILMQIRDK